MNINRTKLKDFLDSKSGVELFLGNKIVKCSRNGKAYFDISTDKEVFVKKESGEIFSVTDVSNFQNLHKPAIYVDSNNKPLNSESMVIPYTNLHLFTPMDERKYYVVHLQPLWLYGQFDDDSSKIMDFLRRYNEKNTPIIEDRIVHDRLQQTDFWYIGGEYMKEENYVSVVSVYEDNLVKALGAVYDGGVSPSKCIKKSFGKR